MARRGVIVTSPPNGGKGGAAELLTRYGFHIIPMGDRVRAEIKTGRISAEEAKVMKSGGLVCDDIITQLAQEEFEKALLTGKDLAFEGVPRTRNQADFLLPRLLKSFNGNLVQLHLDTPYTECERRRGLRWEELHRVDDTPEVFVNRLKVYQDHTIPAMDLIRQMGVHTVSVPIGHNEHKEVVRQRIATALDWPYIAP